MKVFWGIIGVMAILTAALLLGGRESGPDPETTDQRQPAAPQPTRANPGANRTITPEPEPADPSSRSSDSAPTPPSAAAKESPAGAQRPQVEPPAEPETDPSAQAGAKQSTEQLAQPPREPKIEKPVEAVGASRNETLTPNAPADIESTDGASDSGEIETPTKEDLEALVKELQAAAGGAEEKAAESAGDPTQRDESASGTPESQSEDANPAPAQESEAQRSPDAPTAPESSAGNVESNNGSSGSANAAANESSSGEAAERDAKPDPTKPQVVPSTFEKRDDGSTLVDNRFVMRGVGSKDDPYQVTWDMLVATAELYDPRRDKLKIPERVKMLDGKYVKIVGYVAFPIVAEGPNEMLAMLNAWDGCCIGVPPTPYDAIEVRLRDNATAEQMLMNWGSITGKFKVEPYLAANWLLGLYLMEDAVLKPESM